MEPLELLHLEVSRTAALDALSPLFGEIVIFLRVENAQISTFSQGWCPSEMGFSEEMIEFWLFEKCRYFASKHDLNTTDPYGLADMSLMFLRWLML